MAKTSCAKTEKCLLSLLLKSPLHMKALNLNVDLFNTPEHKTLANIMKKFVNKYKSPPTKESLKDFANTLLTGSSSLNKIPDAIMLLDQLPKVKVEEFSYYFNRIENYKLGRDLHDILDEASDNFGTEEVDFVKLRQSMLKSFLSIGPKDSTIKRSDIFDTVLERWEEYKKAENGTCEDLIPFGIKALDEHLGGMRREFLTLVYSKTSGGKTRTAINIAYNAALAGLNVMYLSLEMSFNLLGNCFDSRMSWTDSKKIIFGKLDTKDRKLFKQALKKQYNDKLNVWIVDIKSETNSAQVLEEIEIYKATKGVNPDLIILDYANLMLPVNPYFSTSDRYGVLFQELKQIARLHNVAILTATQESRTKTQADVDKKKKGEEKDTEGVQNIGLSNQMAPHCDIVIRLKQDKYDRALNRLWAIIDKGRYGIPVDPIPMISLWEYTYVGDKVVPGTMIKRAVS